MENQTAKSSSSKPKKGYEDVKQGIKQLYPAEDSKTTTNLDIIFVPGLGANPEESWKSTKGDFNWASDKNGIAKDFPNARVLLYQYESAFHGPLKVEQFMDNIAKGLLHSLQSKREVRQNNNKGRGTVYFHRPIVLIGHSMGGLVIAKAVTMMDAQRTTFPKMLEATAGCIFFGSPFRGAQAASVAAMFSLVGEKFGQATTSKLLDLMKPEDVGLLELRSEFLRLVNDLNPKIGLFCFWENHDTDVAKMGADFIKKREPAALAGAVSNSFYNLFKRAAGPIKIVDRDSATFGDVGIPNLGLACNHRDLVKFDSFRDERYDLVRDPLKRIIHDAPLNAKNRLNSTRDIDLDVIKSLSDALGGEPVLRRRKILEQKIASSSWIPMEREFTRWLSKADGDEDSAETQRGDCVWVCGAEGRGKTGATIAALEQIEIVLKDDREKSSGKAPILLAYYFCDPASDSTAEELIKSLLFQLIQRQYLFASYAKQFTKREGKNPVSLSVENLWQSLQDMLTDETASSMVYFVINNLHSLPEDSESTKKLMSLIKSEMENMNNDEIKRTSVRWLFTSRKAKLNIEDNLRVDGVRLIDLEDDKYADQVQLELRKHAREKVAALESEKKYKKDLAYYVSSLIGNRAKTTGWIDITTDQLKEIPENESALKVRQTLKRLPQSLDSLLDEAWEQIFNFNKDRAEDIKEMLRALVLTYEDPTLLELAILAGLPADEHGSEELRDLVGKCPSFLFLKGKADPRVCFKNAILKPHLVSHADKLLGLSADEIKWQHGELALRSFLHLLERFNIPESEAKPAIERGKAPDQDNNSASHELDEDSEDEADEDGETEEDEEDEDVSEGDDDEDSYDSDSDEVTEPEITALPYMVKHWLHHASKATIEMAEDLSRETEFWKQGSLIRRRWLAQYDYLTDAFEDLDRNTDSLTALHVAASIGFKQLVAALMRNGHKDELNICDTLENTPLHLAAFFGRPNIVEELIFQGARVDEGDQEDNATPLCMAAFKGNIKVMTMLLDGKANPSAIDDWVGTVLNAAIQSGNLEAVKLLVERGASITEDPEKSPSSLGEAAALPDRAIFDYLKDVGSEALLPGDYGSALVAAANAGNFDVFNELLLEHEHDDECLQKSLDEATDDGNWNIVESLLNNQAGLNCNDLFETLATGSEDQDELLKTVWNYSNGSIEAECINRCLYEATDKEKESTVRLLLEICHADPNATGYDYGNALTAASYDGTIDIIKMLLDAGADVNSPDGWALQTAAATGHEDVVKELIARGANINACFTDERFSEGTALQAAVEASRVDMVKLLLESGADPDLGAGELTCPLIAAAIKGESDVLRLLVEHNAKVDVFGGPDSSTPLINAAMYMTPKDLKVLLDGGADINLPDVDGDTALIIAAVCGEAASVEFLLANGADVLPVSKTRGINALQAALQADNRRCLELLINHVSALLKDVSIAEKKVDLKRSNLPHRNEDTEDEQNGEATVSAQDSEGEHEGANGDTDYEDEEEEED